DGDFVYAVRSTGIYCRPSCPAKRPGRDQVLFFETPQIATRAGYRACKRCRPGEADAQARRIGRLCRYIEEHLDETLDLATLSAEVGMSPGHAQRTFKRIVGVSPREYAESRRVRRFKETVRDGGGIMEAIFESGYGSTSRLYERSANH